MENLKDHIEAILFDLDGTLMDTDNQSVEKFARLFEKIHLPDPERLARKLVMASETPVNGLITLIDRMGIDQPLMDFWQKLSFGKGIVKYEFQIIPGVADMLEELSGRYLLAVVTTRSRAEAEVFLQGNNLTGLFEVVVTRTSTFRLKPHPEPILYAAKQLGVSAHRCLMVGDTTPDIRSARSAGAYSAGVLCGYGTRDELEKAGATVVLEHTKMVAGLFNR